MDTQSALTFLDNLIADSSILRHPFYLAWTRGTLTHDQLCTYAKVYYPHVAAFPGYLRNTITCTEDAATVRVLRGNLEDELHHPAPHPELWLDFVEAMGTDRDALRGQTPTRKTAEAIGVFNRLTAYDSASGLTALYVYESQQPEVAQEKERGLRSSYGVTSDNALRYFQVHAATDLEHRAGEREGLARCLETGVPAKAIEDAARETLAAYWNLLEGVCEEANVKLAA